MKITGQTEKEKAFLEAISKKNKNRVRLNRGQYVESEMKL